MQKASLLQNDAEQTPLDIRKKSFSHVYIRIIFSFPSNSVYFYIALRSRTYNYKVVASPFHYKDQNLVFSHISYNITWEDLVLEQIMSSVW